MDQRWLPISRDSARDVKVVLHPTASMEEVGHGVSVDGVDLSVYMSQGQQTQYECSVTLHWNRELFQGGQPKINHILEVQVKQSGVFQTLWLGAIYSITQMTVLRGERSMQLIARTRDQEDIWRKTKRVTPLFPMLTDTTYIVRRIAEAVGMIDEDVLIPEGAYHTAHTNTQLADMTGWDMIENLFVPLGWWPFIDGLGRLRAADKNLQGREPSVVLIDERVVKAGGSKHRSQASRVRILWRDPLLKKSLQQGRLLREVVITMGWFLPFLKKSMYFSEDKTQRAEGTYMEVTQSVNNLVHFCTEDYAQIADNKGRITLVNYAFAASIISLIGLWSNAHNVPDGVAGTATVPTGRRTEAVFQVLFTFLLMNLGTGIYEIWGQPFEYVHPRNTTEAFNDALPRWVDSPKEIECDFIQDENHAQAVAVRELIWETRSASGWTLSIVDDLRLEFGDIIQLPDGNKMYVQDYRRSLTRGSEAVLEVSGFLV